MNREEMAEKARKNFQRYLDHGTDFRFGTLGEFIFVIFADEDETRSRQLESAEDAEEYDRFLREEARKARDAGKIKYVRFTNKLASTEVTM
ncbi:hypothetical protein J6Z39_09075 [bacterium]|nr:hypothetical protein [bacterium]MBP5435955.1 hypothetical protein [bacterium]